MHRSLLIDSDILIDHLRKEKKALDFLDTEIEKGSLLFGLHPSVWTKYVRVSDRILGPKGRKGSYHENATRIQS